MQALLSPESAQGTETPCQQGLIKVRFPTLGREAGKADIS